MTTKLTDGVHGNDAVAGLAEGSGPGQVLSTHSEDVGESLHQAGDLHVQRVEEGPVHSGPVFAVHLLPLDPVAQDRTAVILRLVPGDVGTACRDLVDSGSVGSVRRIWGGGGGGHRVSDTLSTLVGGRGIEAPGAAEVKQNEKV